jgi:hypothetical protein
VARWSRNLVPSIQSRSPPKPPARLEANPNEPNANPIPKKQIVPQTTLGGVSVLQAQPGTIPSAWLAISPA